MKKCPEDPPYHIDDLEVPEEVYLIGKGPSLDNFYPEPNSFLVCINETINISFKNRRLQKVPVTKIMVTCDAAVLKNTRTMPNIKLVVLERFAINPAASITRWRYTFPYEGKTYSTLFALKMCELKKVKKVKMIGFDGLKGNHQGNPYADRVKNYCARQRVTSIFTKQVNLFEKFLKETIMEITL